MRNYSTAIFKKMNRKQMRDYVFNYYRDNLQDTTLVNKDTGITIYFNKEGRHKTASQNASISKSVVIIHLKQLLTEAKRIKTVQIRKGTAIDRDFPNALFVMNFFIKCKIDGYVNKFVCGVVLLKTGRFQYSLYKNELRQKK